jgi:predicted nucleotide-binding protein
LYDIPANDLADQVISDEARSEVSDVSNFIESAVLKAKDSSSVMQRKNDETTANSGIAISNSDDIKSKRIWVIHGRNEKLVRDIFSFLRAIDLHPIEWSEARAKTGVSSPYIGEILKAGFDYAQAFVVMLTGDDEAKLRNEYIKQNDPHYERNLTPQARQNVIFEAGMAFGRDPGRIIFVQQGNLRPFSNISGIHILELNNTPQARIEFISRLKSAGCDVPDVATRQDWLIEGDFEPSVSGQSNSVLEIQASSLGATRSTENNLGVPENPKLSKEAQTLLKEATQDPYGIILRTNTSDGLGVKSNEKNFVTDSSPRTRALWEGAIRELVEHDLIKDRGHNQALFEVTIKGFQVEEKLQEAN